MDIYKCKGYLPQYEILVNVTIFVFKALDFCLCYVLYLTIERQTKKFNYHRLWAALVNLCKIFTNLSSNLKLFVSVISIIRSHFHLHLKVLSFMRLLIPYLKQSTRVLSAPSPSLCPLPIIRNCVRIESQTQRLCLSFREFEPQLTYFYEF